MSLRLLYGFGECRDAISKGAQRLCATLDDGVLHGSRQRVETAVGAEYDDDAARELEPATAGPSDQPTPDGDHEDHQEGEYPGPLEIGWDQRYDQQRQSSGHSNGSDDVADALDFLLVDTP